MPNIHTLKDLEEGSGPNRQPLPNPWKKYPQQRASLDSPYSGMQYSYVGLDGYEHQSAGPITPKDMCCGSCCPCFVRPLWSADKKQQYLNLMKSFCFVVSMIDIIMFIVELGMGGFVSAQNNPMLGPGAQTMLTLGAKYSPLERYHYQVYRFIVPIFLHAGVIHIAFNLFAQLRTGLYLERQWGAARLISFYFLAGIGGTLMSSLVEPDKIGVGASGAIMGLMGGYFAELLWAGHQMDPRQRKIQMGSAVLFIVVTMMFGFSQYVDWSAHLGGVLVGFVYGTALFSGESAFALVRRAGLVVCSVLIVAYFVLGFALFYTVAHIPTN